MIILMIGSALCTASPTTAFPLLLLGRALEGMGCAGITVVVRVILSDKVSLKENAKNWSLLSLTAGMSYAIGPALGGESGPINTNRTERADPANLDEGYLTKTNWRWCFGINLIVCLAAIIIVLFVLRRELLGPQELSTLNQSTNLGPSARLPRRIMVIDTGGQSLFLTGFVLLTLGLTWGGVTYAWSDAIVLVAISVGCIILVLFVVWEYLMAPDKALALRWPVRQPMMPWKLISNRDIALLFYITFATGAAMYAVSRGTATFAVPCIPVLTQRKSRSCTSATCISQL
jgi:MFS family permease